MHVYFSLVAVAVVGVLVYALAKDGKIAELGRIVFFCAFLALCFGAPNMPLFR